jgi:hypothetical protein
VPQPAIRTGASAALITTVANCTTIVGFAMPVPRSAAPNDTSANCSAIAGRKAYMYSAPAFAVAASAARPATYRAPTV